MRNIDRKHPLPALNYRNKGKAIQDNQQGEDRIENPVYDWQANLGVWNSVLRRQISSVQ